MFSLFRSTKARGEYALGIDIGTTSIKAVELKAEHKQIYMLTNYAMLEVVGHLEHFNNALQSSSLRPLEQDLINYLSLIKKESHFNTNHVIASLPSFAAFTTLLELPAGSPAEIGKSLSVQARDYIPLPLEEVMLDWIPIGTKTYPGGEKKQQIFLISIPHEVVERYTSLFSSAGFILDSFEVEHVSIARALTRAAKSATLIIDIGGRSTTFTVAKNGITLFAGQTDFSSNSLTQALATALNINPRRADKLKRETAIISGGGSHELSAILIPIIDVILNEAQRIRSGFENSFAEKIESLVLSGGGANMPGFSQYLTSQLNLPVQVAAPWTEIATPPEIEGFRSKLGTTLTVALGLALKKLI